MTTAEKFQNFYDCLRTKSIYFATRLFQEEPIIKFYQTKLGNKQKVSITFADQSTWEGEETVASESGGL